ncbi:MAG: hypothetical protein ACK5NK_12560 [Niabella sp.]
MNNSDEIVVVKIYDNMAEAISAKEKLEEAGIKAIIDDMNVVGLTPLSGIEVRIFSSNLEQATKILDN